MEKGHFIIGMVQYIKENGWMENKTERERFLNRIMWYMKDTLEMANQSVRNNINNNKKKNLNY
jgi:hypothetical protein